MGSPPAPTDKAGAGCLAKGTQHELYAHKYINNAPLFVLFSFVFVKKSLPLAPAHLMKTREETAGLGFHVYVVRVVLAHRPACLSDVDG